MKILIVDDSTTMRQIIKKALLSSQEIDNICKAHFVLKTKADPQTLTKNQYLELIEAVDGKDALGKIKTADLVLTDWNMPNMDGLTFLKLSRSISKTIPIIMVTTESGQEEVSEAIKHGINDYIVKPFTNELIIEKVLKFIKKIFESATV